MIRMIASDIDGTLLQNGQESLPPEIHGIIRQLAARGITFCVASGRQFSNLYSLFGESAAQIGYVCENGALVFGKGQYDRPLKKLTISRDLIRELSVTISEQPECDILFSAPDVSYLMLKSRDTLRKIQPYLGDKTVLIDSVEEIRDEIVQVSAYCGPGTHSVWDAFSHLRDRVHVVVSGPHWIDFSCATKGLGLKYLCDALSVAPDEVMAFGDNFNDVPMLDLVGSPFIMENAVAALRERYPQHCENVIEVLRTRFLL